MSLSLINLSLKDARDGLRNKEFTAQELVEAHIRQAEACRDLNCFITETFDQALDAARSSDEKLAKGTARKLEGLPLGIKDLFCTKGVRTTAASKILENYKPEYESTITQNLLDDGAVFLGKLNLDEFAMGSANMTSAFGPVKSPWKATGADAGKYYVPGGSSGGSSAAVAANLCLGATATDTGGSIRQPAAFTGTVGLKPTYGRCSRYGVVAFASSLDQAGPITKTVTDAAIMLESMASYDPKDATSFNCDVPNYESHLTGDVKGLKIGVPKEYRVQGLNAEIEQQWDQALTYYKEAGAEIVEISLPHTKYALPSYYIIAPAEASSNLARYDGVRYGYRTKEAQNLVELYEKTRAEGFGEEVKRRIMIGTYVLSAGYFDAYYLKAQKLKRLIAQDFQDAFKRVDFILAPTTPTPAFAFGEEPKDPVSMYMNDVLTVPANIAGLPGISVPTGLSKNGLPLGMQLIAPAFAETGLLNAAYFLETAADFATTCKKLRSAS